MLVNAGFRRSRYNPALHHHKEKDILTMVHGDDFVSSADKENLKWLEKDLKDRHGHNTHRMGAGRETEAKVTKRLFHNLGKFA